MLSQHVFVDWLYFFIDSKRKEKPMEVEEDEDVLMRRQRQLDYGKLTISYRNYRQQIPRRVLTFETRNSLRSSFVVVERSHCI